MADEELTIIVGIAIILGVIWSAFSPFGGGREPDEDEAMPGVPNHLPDYMWEADLTPGNIMAHTVNSGWDIVVRVAGNSPTSPDGGEFEWPWEGNSGTNPLEGWF